MTTGEILPSQRRLRETARAKLTRIEEDRSAGQYPSEEVLREALTAVSVAAVRATPKTIGEFTSRLAKEAVVVGDLKTDPEGIRLWRPFTTGSGRSTRRDGQIIDTSGEYQVLDIASQGDSCCVTRDQATQADEAWRAGEVLLIDHEEPVNCPALLLPRRNVPAQWIGEALGRHFQAPVSSPELVA